jgi:hypothetical protein
MDSGAFQLRQRLFAPDARQCLRVRFLDFADHPPVAPQRQHCLSGDGSRISAICNARLNAVVSL